jgi:hypothetical protein
MEKLSDDIVLSLLREIRSTQEEHSRQLQALPRIEKQLAEFSELLRYSVGLNTEMKLRDFLQEGSIDEFSRQSETGRSEQRLSGLDELIEQFEKMSPEERRRSIEHANEVLRAEGVKALDEKTD